MQLNLLSKPTPFSVYTELTRSQLNRGGIINAIPFVAFWRDRALLAEFVATADPDAYFLLKENRPLSGLTRVAVRREIRRLHALAEVRNRRPKINALMTLLPLDEQRQLDGVLK